MTTLIGALIVFMLVVLLHELGHFTVAKLVGIKVNEFSIGMGPKLFQKEKGETKYSLRLLPIGGYVAMEGEEEGSNDPRSFGNVSVLKRMAVVLAGAFMNFILAIVAFFIVALFIGSPTNKVGFIVEDSPAYISEIKLDDEIVAVNGVKVSNWQDTLNNISNAKDENIDLTIKRENKDLNIIIKADLKEDGYKIGIGSKNEKSLTNAFSAALINTWVIVKSIFSVFKLIFSGNFNMNMLAGPVGVVSMIGQETSKGAIYLINILGVISANLGVVNLLPIPALDGGKFIFLLIEAIRKKPISEKVESTLSYVGFSLLIGLMLYVTIFGDLARIFGR